MFFKNTLNFTNYFALDNELFTGEGYEQENKSADHRAI